MKCSSELINAKEHFFPLVFRHVMKKQILFLYSVDTAKREKSFFFYISHRTDRPARTSLCHTYTISIYCLQIFGICFYRLKVRLNKNRNHLFEVCRGQNYLRSNSVEKMLLFFYLKGRKIEKRSDA